MALSNYSKKPLSSTEAAHDYYFLMFWLNHFCVVDIFGLQTKHPFVYSLLYCLLRRTSSISIFNKWYEIQTNTEVIEVAYYLFQPTSRNDGGGKGYLARRIHEKPDLTWWGAAVTDILLSDREDGLMKRIVRYAKWGLYAAINGNVMFLNPNKNDELLPELSSVDQACIVNLCWCFKDEEVPRCFVTHTPFKDMKSSKTVWRNIMLLERLLSTIAQRHWRSLYT